MTTQVKQDGSDDLQPNENSTSRELAQGSSSKNTALENTDRLYGDVIAMVRNHFYDGWKYRVKPQGSETFEAVSKESYDAAHTVVDALISSLTNEAELRGRQEQIMQDFLSLNVEFDGCVDEKDLIEWREESLAALLKLSRASSLKPERSQESKPRKEGQ